MNMPVLKWLTWAGITFLLGAAVILQVWYVKSARQSYGDDAERSGLRATTVVVGINITLCVLFDSALLFWALAGE